MLFRRLFLCALFVGLCAGLVTSVVQRFTTVPLIAAAEVFESALEPEAETPAVPPSVAAPAAEHVHEVDAWEPQDGLERGLWTVIADVLCAIGFALLLIPAMAVWDRHRGGQGASWKTGLLWGLAGWLAVFVWPSFGLHPELPGEIAAGLHARQTWWILAVACAGTGFGLLALRSDALRWLGLPLLALPFIIGAPLPDGSAFARFSADATVQMQALQAQFVVATGIASAVQWLVLGAASGLVVSRWVRPLLVSPSDRGMVRREMRPA